MNILTLDDKILKQMKKLKEGSTKSIMIKMMNKLEEIGCKAGKLVSVKDQIYDLKNKHPPLILYYKCGKTNQIIILRKENQ